MDANEMRNLVGQCAYPPYTFVVEEGHGGIHLQAWYLEKDIVTKRLEKQFTRKWLLSPAMTRSEIVQTAFKLVMTSAEHRARETFKYRGRRIFGPHFDVDNLHQLCGEGSFDVRPQGAAAADSQL